MLGKQISPTKHGIASPEEFVGRRSFAGYANGFAHTAGTPLFWKTLTWRRPKLVEFGLRSEGGVHEISAGAVVVARANGVTSLRTFERVPGILRKLAFIDYQISGPVIRPNVEKIERGKITPIHTISIGAVDYVKLIPNINDFDAEKSTVEVYDRVSSAFDAQQDAEFSTVFAALRAIREQRR